MKPFNLEHALAHPEDVISRDGREIAFIAYDEGAGECQRLIIRFKNEFSIKVFFSNGNYWDSGEESCHDLFLKPRNRTVYVNFYEDGEASWFETEEEAKENVYDWQHVVASGVPVKIED